MNLCLENAPWYLPLFNHPTNRQIGAYGPTKEMREEYADEGAGPPSIDALLERQDARTIRARESDYQRRGREARVLTPTRKDAFSNDSEGSVV